MSTNNWTVATTSSSNVITTLGYKSEILGRYLLRYSLVLILLWIGGMKFTRVEAEAIKPFVENSPLFAWTYDILGVQGLSNLLGVLEIGIGLLIAARPWFPQLAAIGSLLAVGMFFSTLSFLVTTPGSWDDHLGFPAIGVLGQFVIKDVALLAISIWSFGEAIRANRVEMK